MLTRLAVRCPLRRQGDPRTNDKQRWGGEPCRGGREVPVAGGRELSSLGGPMRSPRKTVVNANGVSSEAREHTFLKAPQT